MKITRLFTIALAVAAPTVVLADDKKPDDTKEDKEVKETTSDIDKPKDTDLDSQDRVKQTSSDIDKTKDTTLDSKETVKLRAHVVPAVAGIEAADKAIGAIYELTSEETIDVRDVRDTVSLARQGISLAMDRAESLNGMSSLSEDADSETARAMTKLGDARTTLVRMEKQLKKGKLSATQIEQIHAAARDLHNDLSDASNAVEKVAKAYDVPTDFEFEG